MEIFIKNKKIKVARIATVPLSFTHILDLLKYLDQSDEFELHIVCSYSPYLDELRIKYKNTIFHEIYIPRNIELLNDLKSLIELTKLFAKERYDIVHSHTPKAGLVTALAGFLTTRKIRLHVFTGQVWANSKGLKKFVLKSIDKFIALLNTKNYADSIGQKKLLIAENIGSEKSLSVLHKGSMGGINIDRFDPEKILPLSLKEKERLFPNYQGKIILYLGRLNRDKGLAELASAFNQLKKKHDVKLLLVGPFETMEDEIFSSLINELKNDEAVTHLDFVSNPEVYLGLCDIFCFPSYREGFGTVALEASAMEKPIVASNIYGLLDAISDQETGLLFEVKNPLDLEEKMTTLLSDPEYAKKLGKQGRIRVIRDFTDRILTEKMIEEYFHLIKASHG